MPMLQCPGLQSQEGTQLDQVAHRVADLDMARGRCRRLCRCVPERVNRLQKQSIRRL